MKKTGKPPNADPVAEATPAWDLRLYVAGPSAKSAQAFRNLEKICEEHLPGQYHIKVIDLIENPKLARGEQIIAVPTVVRTLPAPICKVVGDLSNTERVLVGLDLRPRNPKSKASRKPDPHAS